MDEDAPPPTGPATSEPDPSGAPNAQSASRRPDGGRLRGMAPAGSKTLIDITAGPPGSPSSEQAIRRVNAAIIDAIGPIFRKKRWARSEHKLGPEPQSTFGYLPDDHRNPLEVLQEQVAKVMRAYPTPRDAPPLLPGPAPLTEADEMFMMISELGNPELPPEPPVPPPAPPRLQRAEMPYLMIPRRWMSAVTQERGRGAKRSRRAYGEAIHLLAYIVYMYRTPYRFPGTLLHINTTAIKRLLNLTQGEYVDALRHLQTEGFITRVIIRGMVPWDPRKKGMYMFAIPRIPKLRGITRVSARTQADSE